MEKVNTDAPIIAHGGPPLRVWVCKNCGTLLGAGGPRPAGCCGPDHVIEGDALTAKLGPDGKVLSVRYL